MPTMTLTRGTHIRIALDVRPRVRVAYVTKPRLSGTVEAERAVDVYVLTESALEDFDRGGSFPVLYSSEHSQFHELSVSLPRSGSFYCVIINRSDANVAVHYELSVQ